jgi:hypothetical protein
MSSSATANLQAWLSQQQKRSGYADLASLSDMLISTPDDDEVGSFVLGILGEAPGIQDFLKELIRRRGLVRSPP